MTPQNLPKPLNSAPRIEKLSVLPVFLDVNGKTAIVIGDSVGALWKAELLAQAGAAVTLISDHAGQEALQLANRFQSVQLEPGPWHSHDFTGAAVVVADVSEVEVRKIAEMTRSAGAIFNAIDRAEFCQFQFGAIVNRSPLVIGISTSGSAPVLAQIVRGLIEVAVPEALQKFAAAAQKIRSRVNARLATATERRDFWNSYFLRALGKFGDTPKGSWPYVINKSSAEDLTLRDLQMLRQAEAVYVAPGANARIAIHARREARRFIDCQLDELSKGLRYSVLVETPVTHQPTGPLA